LLLIFFLWKDVELLVVYMLPFFIQYYMCIPKVKLLVEIKENKIDSVNAKNIVFYASLFCVDISAAHLFIKSMSCIITIIFNDTTS
jgi:hypothetical protein